MQENKYRNKLSPGKAYLFKLLAKYIYFTISWYYKTLKFIGIIISILQSNYVCHCSVKSLHSTQQYLTMHFR